MDRYATELFEQLPKFRLTCLNFLKSVDTNQLNEETISNYSEFLLRTACYEHDIGYLTSKTWATKLVMLLLAPRNHKNISQIKRRAFLKIGMPDDIIDLVISKINDLILNHNADVKTELPKVAKEKVELPFGFLHTRENHKNILRKAYGTILLQL